MKVLAVVGTRPEAIKMAPVVKSLSQVAEIDVCLVATAQHRGLLDGVLSFFGLVPHHDLDVMSHAQGLADVTSRVLHGLGQVLAIEKPDIVLVHGDTNTTMSASLAAYYDRTPVGHVEAGLRTGNKYSPWPEEINRRVTGTIADLHFAPTERARANLLSENVPDSCIVVTGNTVVDALLMAVSRLDGDEEIRRKYAEQFAWVDPTRRLVLVTGHRRENFGEGFREIAAALHHLASRGDVQVVYPVHPNPNVRGPVDEMLGQCEHVHLIDPLDYPAFVYLMQRSHLILTDSGGVQEEAPSIAKPVLVMRDTTERPEAVECGAAQLVGASAQGIIAAANALLDDAMLYDTAARVRAPYGDGLAAQRIAQSVLEWGRRR